MFDGNHRSRRNINLSGGGGRRPRSQRPGSTAAAAAVVSAPSSTSPLRPSVGEGIEDRKRHVLESSRILREERRIQQSKEKAAKQIQRHYRGWQTRRQLVIQTWTILFQQQQQQQQQQRGVDVGISSPPVALLLSLLLSPPLFAVWKHQADQADHLRHALLQYGPSAQDSAVSKHRILQAMLQELRPNFLLAVDSSQRQQTAAYLSRLLQQTQAILQLPSQNNGNNTGNLAVPLVTQNVFLELANCTKMWLWRGSASNILQLDEEEVVSTLWKWSCGVQVDPVLAQQQQALLATILLGWKTGLFQQKISRSEDFTQQMLITLQLRHSQGGNGASAYYPCVQDLVSIITEFKIGTSLNDGKQQPLLISAIADNLGRRQNTLLSNVLDLCGKNASGYPPSTVIRFIYHTFAQRPDVAFLSSLVAGGVGEDSLRALVGLDTSPHPVAVAMDTNIDDDDDDDPSLDGDDGLVRAPNNGADTVVSRPSKASTSAGRTGQQQQQRLTRQEVQTLPKLDRLYQQQVQLWRQQVITECKWTKGSFSPKTKDGLEHLAQLELLVDVAQQMGNGKLWLEWGIEIFSSRLDVASSSATSKTAVSSMETDEEDDRPQDLYLSCLLTLLHSSASLRPITSAQSPLLSQLAFSRSFLERLWQYFFTYRKDWSVADSSSGIGNSSIQKVEQRRERHHESFWCIANVVGHVFSHYLIAISDDEFLLNHTVDLKDIYKDPTANTTVSILAEDGIAYLRTMLHELYWTKPVCATDIRVPYLAERDRNRDSMYLRSLRACAMLAGTKLWNSLYERWCRLVRTAPFCDEACWWFPLLVGDASVVNHRSSQHSHNQQDDEDDVDRMDVDDSSVEEMDGAQVAMDAESEELAGAFRDPKMARILTSIPQALPFDRRVKMFHSLLAADKLKTQDESREFRQAVDRMIMMRGEGEDFWAPREVVSIHRDNMYEDSMEQLNKLGPRLKERVQVTFINQHGTQEAGIDGGGVFKEFLDDLIKDAFVGDIGKRQANSDSSPRLFKVTPLQTLAVNPEVTQDPNLLPHYEFLGRVLGKAVYESILVEPQFCLPFLNKLLGKPNSLEDLKNFDAEYHKNLNKLRTMREDEINGLGLAFEITIGSGDRARTVELMPGGRTMTVTKENLSQYVHLVAHHLLNVQGAPQTRAFLRGFRDLIPASWVRLFSSYELQKLIGGDDSVRGIDVASLKQSMQYSAGYHPSQPIIEWFWEVVNELTPEQQRKLLKFMTSCSRQPLLGFSSLEPAPCIQQIRIPDDVFRGDADTIAKQSPLPTSSTCMNLLKLPNYRDKDLLRKKLLDAIEAGAGFELT